MNVSEAQLYYFSPTHTSKRVGEAVAAGLQAARLVENDLTHTPADDAILPSSSVAVVAVPVYRGSVAPLALERLQGLHGDGTPVVLLAVYGNRDYEHALDDLDRFMTERGFVTVAAGTFVGELSWLDKLRFVWYGLGLKVSKKPMPVAPVTDPGQCNGCGVCAIVCPTGAIAAGNELHTDASRCIRCCACVKSCRRTARSFDTPFAKILTACCARPKQPHVLL